MKCLSVTRTWAWLLAQGIKPVENRTWYTNYRGPLLTHASKTNDRRDYDYLAKRGDLKLPPYEEIPFGRLVGITHLHGCSKLRILPRWHNEGYWGWYVRNAFAFTHPPEVRGQLGLFNVEPESLPLFTRREINEWRKRFNEH